MTTSKLTTTTAAQAFSRVKPLLDRLRHDLKAAANIVAKEYDALPKLEKADFADRVRKTYGWSQRRLNDFALIGRRLPEKEKVISMRAPAVKLDRSNTELMHEIVKTDDKLLAKAADKGMFDETVSARDVHRLRTKGMLPSDVKPIPTPKTDLQKIKAWMVDAEHHINRASLDIGKITSLMLDAEIHDAKGREATSLINAFEKLCTKMATANPVTSKRAFAILKGDA
ncbi:MAG: hypothetical protein GY938_05435 [Ketobacter sp.]|nr:hypothetical protein [Ketobacter sp.]